MSEPLRVALVAEGPTDGVVIEAALQAIIPEDRPFILKQIFPEGSDTFGKMGTGWAGVYRWCHQSARRGAGRLEGDSVLFQNYDLLILHLDADVAANKYANGSIAPNPTDAPLPCERPCPESHDTTNALREVLLSWCGEANVPAKTVICMPSKSTEAWVVAALFPNDRSVLADIECFPNPQSRLAQQSAKSRISKSVRDYRSKASDFVAAWPRLSGPLTEALRFETEFLSVLDDTAK
jgi:hypothetical protein